MFKILLHNAALQQIGTDGQGMIWEREEISALRFPTETDASRFLATLEQVDENELPTGSQAHGLIVEVLPEPVMYSHTQVEAQIDASVKDAAKFTLDAIRAHVVQALDVARESDPNEDSEDFGNSYEYSQGHKDGRLATLLDTRDLLTVLSNSLP